MRPLSDLRVALVHDYLNQPGGAERVVEVFCRMFPKAPLYTSLYDAGAMPDFWRGVDVRTSFMQRLPTRVGVARALLPLYPLAFESFDLSEFDLVLTSSSTFAKGVITRAGACHVCYCYTPTRFAWMYHDYTGRQRLPAGSRVLLPLFVSPLRVWDYAAAQRVDHFIAISSTVAGRMRKYYRRPSTVIYPPVETSAYQVGVPEDFYLVLARLQAYKRIDLAVEACTRLGVRLIVAGDGPDRPRLERLAGPSVEFLGRVSDARGRELLSTCRALLWPGEEDFGLVPVEAQASGRPVIAFKGGGAAETVIDGQTGMLFEPQTVEGLMEAIRSFDPDGYEPDVLRANAARYDVAHFRDAMYAELERAWSNHCASLKRDTSSTSGVSGAEA